MTVGQVPVECTECHAQTTNVVLRLCTPCLTRANDYANNRIKADQETPPFDRHGDLDIFGRPLRFK